jgi:hypothetical protein
MALLATGDPILPGHTTLTLPSHTPFIEPGHATQSLPGRPS